MSGDPRPKTYRAPKPRRSINPMSTKRRRQLPVRDQVRQAVIRRDLSCRAPVMGAPGACAGELVVHEPNGGSERNVSWVDVDRCLLICSAHHVWTHTHPAEAYALGLLVRSGPVNTGPKPTRGDT